MRASEFASVSVSVSASDSGSVPVSASDSGSESASVSASVSEAVSEAESPPDAPAATTHTPGSRGSQHRRCDHTPPSRVTPTSTVRPAHETQATASTISVISAGMPTRIDGPQ